MDQLTAPWSQRGRLELGWTHRFTMDNRQEGSRVRGRYCVLELEFKVEKELHDFVAALRELGWLSSSAVPRGFGHSPPQGPPGVRRFRLKPRPDSRADAVATVRLKRGRGRRTSG